MIDRLAADLRLALAFMSIRWRPAALIAALLALPLIFASPNASTKFHIGLPRVISGDEPHYLVLINSLLRDGDLDLANNYAAVHQGEPQAGLRFPVRRSTITPCGSTALPGASGGISTRPIRHCGIMMATAFQCRGFGPGSRRRWRDMRRSRCIRQVLP